MKTVALIGCGSISRNHIHAIRDLEEMGRVRLVALCDIVPEAAEKLSCEEQISVPIYTDYREMLLKEKPDAVHICTPHHLHTRMAIFALEHQINVFLEKPLCILPEDLERIAEAEKKSTAMLCVCYQNRFLNAVTRAKEMIGTEQVGSPLGARAFVTWCRGGEYYTQSPWRGKIATEGGSVLMNQSIHTLDLLLWFLGDPERVEGAIGNYHTAAYNDTEDTAHLYMTFPDGKVGIFYATTAYCVSSKIELEIVCEKKVLKLTGDKLSVDGVPVLLEQPGKNRGKEVWGKGHGILIARFYEALEKNEPSPVPLEEAARSLKTLWALYQKVR